MFRFSRFLVASVMTVLLFSTTAKTTPPQPTTCNPWEHEQDNPFAANFSGCRTAVAPLSVSRGADGNDGDWYANWMGNNFNRFSLVKGKAYCLEANYPLVQGTNLCDYPLPIVENVDTTKTGDHCWCKVTQYNTYNGEMIDLDSSYIQIPYHFNTTFSYTCNLNYCAQMCSSIGAHSADFYAAQFDYIDGYYWDYANLRASVYRAVKQCVPNKYTITFNTNGGSDIDAATYTYNDLPITLPTPTKSDKVFDGWFDGNTKITQITTSNYGDKTLTAHWTEAGACATGEHEQENPLASKWSNCGIIGDYSAGSYGADGENGDWYASFDISDFVHTIRGKAYCVEQIPNTPAETPDNKQGICGSYSFAISETIDTARTGNYCWCQVTEYKTDNNTDFKPVQSAYIGLPTAFTNPSCTPKLCAQACATVGDYSSGRRTNFDNLARRDNVGLRAAMYQSVKQCLPDDQLTCDEIGYTLQDNECTPITYTITYKDKDNNSITEFVDSPVATTYTIESETITLPTPSAPEGMGFAGWYDNAEFNGNSVTQIAKGTTGDKTLYAKWVETSVVDPDQNTCEPSTNPFTRWAGCDISLNGNGSSSTTNGEWTANFNFGDFITVKGNAYCLQEQYPMPSQKVCGVNTFPIAENVDTTQTGSTCWCKVTAWQPFTPSRDAPFQEVNASYIQIPVKEFESEPCTLQNCGYACASIGNTNSEIIGVYYDNSGLRATIYKSVKQCSSEQNPDQTNCSDGYEYNTTNSSCDAIKYTISYVLNGGINNSNNPTFYTIATPTITLSTPTKSGFDFVGWYDNAEFSGDAITQITKGSYGNKTLYARWVETPIATYTVTWAVGNNGSGSMSGLLNKHAGETITLPANGFNANNGYVFDGWKCDNNIGNKTVNATFIMPADNVTCTAQWRVALESECEPGYYLSQSSNTCMICDENHYCTGGTDSTMKSCPTGLVSPTGTISVDNCGKIMLVGEKVLYLTQKQQTTPALAVKMDGKIYYAKTTPLSQIEQQADTNTKYFLRTKIDNVEYSIHDNTVQRRN